MQSGTATQQKPKLWEVVRALLQVSRAKYGGLELAFFDLRSSGERDRGQARRMLQDALERLSAAKGGFGELIADHLRMVAIMRVPHGRVVFKLRAYVCPFGGAERTSGHYLACKLIWAATTLRLSRDKLAHNLPVDPATIEAAARQAQLRFLQQFDGWEEWAKLLDLIPPSEI
jgi:hypothetical protein